MGDEIVRQDRPRRPFKAPFEMPAPDRAKPRVWSRETLAAAGLKAVYFGGHAVIVEIHPRPRLVR